ncbi:MAG: GntR family transcriptional regulator [Cyclobacteriaceae bacterium]
MIEVGKNNTLEVLRQVEFGFYLGDGDQDVLLPQKYATEDLKVGDHIDVFIYKDSEDRIIATNLEPLARTEEFAYLRVKEINRTGAFLDWGLEKDLMLPYREQSGIIEEGMWVFVYVYFDPGTERIASSMKITEFAEKQDIQLEENQQVDLLICQKTELGYNVIINNLYEGLVYDNEIFRNISPGDRTKGYIKKIRDDKKIDVNLEKPGYDNVEPNAQIILENLKFNGGFLALNDKSYPEEIKEQLSMSKKVFKKAIGGLYKQRTIRIEEDGIYLN